jgi:hypothetical protein
VGIAPGAGAAGWADCEAAAAGLGAVTGAAALPGLLAVTVTVTAGAGPACDEAEQPVTAARLTAAMAAAAQLTGRRAAAPAAALTTSADTWPDTLAKPFMVFLS